MTQSGARRNLLGSQGTAKGSLRLVGDSRHLRIINFFHKHLKTRNERVWRRWGLLTTLLDTSLSSPLWMTKKTTTTFRVSLEACV